MVRGAGQRLLIGFQRILQLTAHGQRGTVVEMVLRVIRILLYQLLVGIGGASVITRLVECPCCPVGVFKTLSCWARRVLDEQISSLLIRALPEILPDDGVCISGRWQ